MSFWEQILFLEEQHGTKERIHCVCTNLSEGEFGLVVAYPDGPWG